MRNESHRFSGLGLGYLSLICAISMAAIFLATRWGPGIDVDSIAYLSAAENIAVGNGIVLTRTPDEHDPMTHWPPIYSVVLAAGAYSELQAIEFARLLGILLIGANVFLVGFVVRRNVSHDFPALVGSLLIASCYAVVWVHAYALSEGLFTLLCIVALASLASYGDKPKRWILILAALAASAATLTRYAGVAIVAAGVITLLLARSATIKRRLLDALLFGAIATIPVIAWQIRNSLVGAPSIGREISIEPFRLYHLKSFFSGLTLWLFPVEIDRYVRLSATLLLLIAIGFGLAYCYRRVRYEKGESRSGPILLVCVNFIVSYWALYAITILVADNGVSLSTRTQMPAFVFTVVLIAVLSGKLLPSGRHLKNTKRTIVAAGCCLALLASANTAKFVIQGYKEGLGYSSDIWRKSELIQLIREMPQDEVVYTNIVAGVQFHANKRTREISGARWTGLSDTAYVTQLRAIITEIKKSNSLIYYFNAQPISRSKTEQKFVEILGLVPVSKHSDGTVYMAR